MRYCEGMGDKMCGITGIFSTKPLMRSKIGPTLDRMTDSLVHRGPDARGVWIEDHAALGHRRLSILDLSPAGQQPMQSPSGRYMMVFNGEIYNHLILRSLLKSEFGFSHWQGSSDTETLLVGIDHWGLEVTLQKANGMFALALYDRKVRTLSLARDRIGEKPLYWGFAGHSLLFGSELKALEQHPEFNDEPAQGALSLFLRYNYIPAPWTIFQNSFKLEPGKILTVTSDFSAPGKTDQRHPTLAARGLSQSSFWDADKDATSAEANLFETDTSALQAVQEAFSTTISQQMLSDVPLGAFLSGGIDSSLVVAEMQSQSSRPIDTFTIGFDDADFNEAPHANAVAQHLGTSHFEMRVTDLDARDVIPKIPKMYDEPFADSSQIPTSLVCQAARQNVTVALSGDGGDEVFGGYNRYIHGPKLWRNLSRIPKPLRHFGGKIVREVPTRTWDRIGAGYSVIRKGSGGIAQLGTKAHRVGRLLGRAHTLESFYRELVSEWDDPACIMRCNSAEAEWSLDDPMNTQRALEPAEWMMIQDMWTYLPGDVLCKVDRAAMSVSLETRAPFLDRQMLDVAARLRADQRIRDGTGKWALRQLLARHVPSALVDRPKMGFAVPVGRWLTGPLRDWAEDLLSEESLRESGLLVPGPIRATWAEHLSGKRDLSARLWGILMLQAWDRRRR